MKDQYQGAAIHHIDTELGEPRRIEVLQDAAGEWVEFVENRPININCVGRLCNIVNDLSVSDWKDLNTITRAIAALEGLIDDMQGADSAEKREDMRAICEALGFDPTNHHNAEKCPYCNPRDPGGGS